MSLKAIKIILASEEAARVAESEAQEKAQQALDETESAGKQAIAATLVRAESEVAHLLRLTDQKATDEARALASTTANRQAAQRARAERLLDTAAQLVFERIVKT